MFGSASFFISWFLVFVLAGAVFYVADRLRGVRIYRWIYDMTHQHPLPKDIARGFIYNRKANARFALAVIISGLQSVIAVMDGISSTSNEILSLFIEVPCLMIGFYFGPAIYKIWERREAVFDSVDKLESGELSLKKEVHELSNKVMEKVKDSMQGEEPALPQTSSSQVEKKEANKVEPEPDPKAMLDKYINPR